MTKILNIDALAKEDRVITLGGVSYPVKTVSVNDYVKISQMVENAEKTGDNSRQAQALFLVDNIMIIVPTCPREVLLERTIDELNIIVTFVRDGTIPEELQEGNNEAKKLES